MATEENKDHEPSEHNEVPQKDLSDLARLGVNIYETGLKSILEPSQNNRFVAIHVDTKDYAVDRTSASASRALAKRHGLDGRMVVMKIGPEPEYGLAARILFEHDLQRDPQEHQDGSRLKF